MHTNICIITAPFLILLHHIITECHCGCQYHVNIIIVALLMSLHPPGAFYSKPIMPRSAAYNHSSTHSDDKQGNQMLWQHCCPTFFFFFFKQESKCYPTFFFFSHFLFQTSIQMLSNFFLFFTFSFSNKHPMLSRNSLFFLRKATTTTSGLGQYQLQNQWSAACIQLFINTLCW